MHDKDYKNLIVWQKSIQLVKAVYAFAQTMPHNERYGLISQVQRASVSIVSNIAEGKGRGTKKDFRHFLIQAQGSAFELETQLIVTDELAMGDAQLRLRAQESALEVKKMLSSFIHKLS